MISKDDLYLWKNEPITQAWFEACETRINDAKDILGTTAGIDPVTDNFYRGFIQAYREMLEFSVEELEQ